MRRVPWLRVFVVACWLFFPLCRIVQDLVGESSHLVFASMELPQLLFCVPLFLVSVVSAILRRWRLAVVSSVFFLFSCLWAGGFCLGSPSVATGPHLRVMTLNVEKFTDHSVAEVAAAIRDAHPDVVCLQEAAKLPPPWQAPHELETFLPGYKLISSGEIGILTRLPVRSFEAIPLYAGPESRPLLLAHIDFGGKEIVVGSVHFQFFPWDDATSRNIEEARSNREVQQLWLRDYAARYRENLVLCGDFNSIPNAPVIHSLREFLADAFAATHTGFGWTVPSASPLRRLDYIFVGTGLKPLATDVPDRIVSDHRAVVADIGFR